jgi:transposase-like protein
MTLKDAVPNVKQCNPGAVSRPVQAFRGGPDGAYPYLWLEAKGEKVRAEGQVEHRTLVVAHQREWLRQREVVGLGHERCRDRGMLARVPVLVGQPRAGRGI